MPAGPLAYVLDRLSGLPVAFGVSSSSYLHTFGGWALALPLALPFALRDCWRAARGRWTAPRQPQQQPHAPAGVFAVFLVVLGAAGLLSLHTIHKAWFNEWNFGTRHALTAALAMLAALLYLARRPGPSRVLALLLLLGGGVGGIAHRPNFSMKRYSRFGMNTQTWFTSDCGPTSRWFNVNLTR